MKVLLITVILFATTINANQGETKVFNFVNVNFDDNTTLNLEMHNDVSIIVKNIAYNVSVNTELDNIFVLYNLNDVVVCQDNCVGTLGRHNSAADPFYIKTFSLTSLNATIIVTYTEAPNDYMSASSTSSSSLSYIFASIALAIIGITLIMICICGIQRKNKNKKSDEEVNTQTVENSPIVQLD